MTVGILSFGGYIPIMRLARKAIVDANAWFNPALRALGRGERAIANWDEDPVTMAVEAARDCLGDRDRAGIAGLYMASTTFPFVDRQSSAVVADALNLAAGIHTMDVANAQRAATSALVSALHAAAGLGGPVLVTAAEKRRTKAAGTLELTTGDGAAALLLGAGETVANVLAVHSETVDFVDHYRGQGADFDYQWEERWVRDEGVMKIVPAVIRGALEKAGLAAGDIDRFCFPAADDRSAGGIAKAARLSPESVADALQADCGQTGAAHPLVMLVKALEEAEPGQKILLASFGQGGDALVLETTEALRDHDKGLGISGHLARRREDSNYSRFLAINDLVTLERGLRAEADKPTALSTHYRKKDMTQGLIGGRCRRCGTLQFPKTNICVNPNCNAVGELDDHPFADMPAKLNSFTADRLTYAPDPPAYYGMVQFEEGGRAMIDFSDIDPNGTLEVGQPMRMMFRVKDYDDVRGFRRYFWKAVPA